MLRKNWRDYLVDGEETEESYIVFEEDENGTKTYDLCKGVFSDLEVAKEYASEIHDDEDIFVANYNEYCDGNYNYLLEVR